MIETKSGRIEFADVKESRGHFHYSTRATKDYRENFGYWNYYAPYGSSFLVGTEEGMLDTRSSPGPHVLNSAGSLVPIPIKCQNAGGGHVTALVHPHRNLMAYWAILPGRPGERIRYPEILQYQFETFPDVVRRALLAEPDMKRWEVLSQTKVEEILDDARRGLLCNMEQAMEEFLREVFGTGVSGGK